MSHHSINTSESIKNKKAALIAGYWYKYYNNILTGQFNETVLSYWRMFRMLGIDFVNTYGTDESKRVLGKYIPGKEVNEEGVLHFLINDR